MDKGLSPKRRLFAEMYAATLSATEAAIRAGYSKLTAAQQGSRLLKNVEIQKYLNNLLNEKSEQVKLTREALLNELSQLALGPGRDMIKINAIKLAGEAIGLFGNPKSEDDRRSEKSKSDAVDAVLGLGEKIP